MDGNGKAKRKRALSTQRREGGDGRNYASPSKQHEPLTTPPALLPFPSSPPTSSPARVIHPLPPSPSTSSRRTGPAQIPIASHLPRRALATNPNPTSSPARRRAAGQSSASSVRGARSWLVQR